MTTAIQPKQAQALMNDLAKSVGHPRTWLGRLASLWQAKSLLFQTATWASYRKKFGIPILVFFLLAIVPQPVIRFLFTDYMWVLNITTPVGVVGLFVILPMSILMTERFLKMYMDKQEEINGLATNDWVTMGLSPKSAEMDDLKQVGLWRRMSVHLQRYNDIPTEHVSWEISGSRNYVTFFMRVPSEMSRGIASEILREFPGTEITIYPKTLAEIPPGQTNTIVDPPFEATQQGDGAFLWIPFRLAADPTRGIYSGETEKSHLVALLSSMASVNPEAIIGYQFLVRGAAPHVPQKWMQAAQAYMPGGQKPWEFWKAQAAPAKITPEMRKAIQAIQERAQQPIYEVSCRAWVFSTDQQIAQMELQRISASLEAETVSMGDENRLVSGGKPENDPESITGRQFPWDAMQMTASDLNAFLYLPGKKVSEPFAKLMQASAKKLPPHPELQVQEGEETKKRTLGHFFYSTGDIDLVGQPFKECRKHTFTIGPTGSGKSVGLVNLALQDFRYDNAGVLIIEPSGTIPALAIEGMTPEEANRAIVLNPQDRQPFALNMLDVGSSLGLDAAVQNAIGAIRTAMANNWDSAVQMQQIITNGLYIVIDAMRNQGETPSMVALQRMLQDESYRYQLLAHTSIEAVAAQDFWEQDFASWSERKQSDSMSVVMRRLNKLMANRYVRRTLSMPMSTIDLTELLGGPLNDPSAPPPSVVMLPLTDRLGGEVKRLMGALFVNYYLSVLFMREQIPEKYRRTGALHLDELKNYVRSGDTEVLERLLAEGRKFGCSANFYAQGLGQMSGAIRTELEINTLTKIVYGLTAPDEARLAEKIMAGSVTTYDMLRVPKYQAYVKVGSLPPALVKMLPPDPYRGAISPPKKGFSSQPAEDWKNIVGSTIPFRRFLNGEPVPAPDSLSDIDGMDLLAHVLRIEEEAMADGRENEVPQKLATELSEDDFAALQQARKAFDLWRAKEVELNPGLIPDTYERVTWLTRWRFGIPWWESDTIYLQMRGVGASSSSNAATASSGVQTPSIDDNSAFADIDWGNL